MANNNLQDAPTVIRDGIGVDMGRADRAHRAADGTRDGLRSLGGEVIAMGRQINPLQTAAHELRGGP